MAAALQSRPTNHPNLSSALTDQSRCRAGPTRRNLLQGLTLTLPFHLRYLYSPACACGWSSLAAPTSSNRDRSVQNVPSPAKNSWIDSGWKFCANV